jgi:hypothetical protein
MSALLAHRTLVRVCGTVFIALTFVAPAAIARPVDRGYGAPPGATAVPAIRQHLRSSDTLSRQPEHSGAGGPTTAPADAGDGIAWAPFMRSGRRLSAGERALFGALIVGLGAGSGLYLMYARRRRGTRLVT